MTDLFDFEAKSSSFAVMGNPVKHSKSPQIHSLFAQQCGITLDYTQIQVDAGGFYQAVSHFSAQGGTGLNITLPYKVEAFQLCQKNPNTLSPRAQLAEAVNTLLFKTDAKIKTLVHGDNTDGAGLVADLQNNIGFSLQDKSILVIGAGGAVRGVIGSLLECQPKGITIANRTADKAIALGERFGNGVQGMGLEQVDGQVDNRVDNLADNMTFDLIINGTSASLKGQLPGISEHYINSNTLVYDMMYNLMNGNQPTVFMKWALSNGAVQVHDGLGMLVEQAAESFHLWHQQRPDSQPVMDALRQL